MSRGVILVTLLALMQFVFLGALVMRARVSLGVFAPAMGGPPAFERLVRVHLNTMERLIVFLPLLWLAANTLHNDAAAAIGVLFIFSRHLYWRGYVRDPARRRLGNVMTMFAIAVLLVMVLLGLARNAMA
ncbi:MAG: MAPEG family protein [Alcaligenaceae bacterium]|nr:MAG: MAPEG family protein [Alcaligenaceae bacterium]